MPQLSDTPHELPPPTPLNNFMFAASFQSADATTSAMSLINAVLLNAGRSPLEIIDELNCEQVLLGDGRKLRGCRLDLAVREGNHHFNLEAQLASLQHMADRMVFNSNRILSHNTFSGTKYENLPNITVISIMNFSFRDYHPDYHQPFGLFYEKDPERVTDKFDYHMLEMPKFRHLKLDITNPLHRWLYYLDSGYKEPENPIIKEAFQMDQGLYQFALQYQHNVSDPRTLDAYYCYMMECMDELDRIDTAEAKGRAEGHIEGRVEGQAAIIRAMMKAMSIADISKVTGLTHEEIEHLATKDLYNL